MRRAVMYTALVMEAPRRENGYKYKMVSQEGEIFWVPEVDINRTLRIGEYGFLFQHGGRYAFNSKSR